MGNLVSTIPHVGPVYNARKGEKSKLIYEDNSLEVEASEVEVSIANKYDIVDNPKHYCSGAHECIDVMEELFGTQAVIDFCKCNIFKYRFRSNEKNGDEDIKKAEWYENKLIELNKKVKEK